MHSKKLWGFVAGIAVVVVALRLHVWHMEEQGLHLQIGNSLYPIVTDYFSWSREEPMPEGAKPIIGEFYSYRRPLPEYASMRAYEKAVAWIYEVSSGGRLATKQCHGVSPDGSLWDTGSDDRWVPASRIVGHVTEIRDSKSRTLSKTEHGRFRLWVERHHLRNDYAFMGDPPNWVVVTKRDPLRTAVFSSCGAPIGSPLVGCSIVSANLGVTLMKGPIHHEHFVLLYPDTGVTIDYVDKDGGLTQSSVIHPPQSGRGEPHP